MLDPMKILHTEYTTLPQGFYYKNGSHCLFPDHDKCDHVKTFILAAVGPYPAGHLDLDSLNKLNEMLEAWNKKDIGFFQEAFKVSPWAIDTSPALESEAKEAEQAILHPLKESLDMLDAMKRRVSHYEAEVERHLAIVRALGISDEKLEKILAEEE